MRNNKILKIVFINKTYYPHNFVYEITKFESIHCPYNSKKDNVREMERYLIEKFLKDHKDYYLDKIYYDFEDKFLKELGKGFYKKLRKEWENITKEVRKALAEQNKKGEINYEKENY